MKYIELTQTDETRKEAELWIYVNRDLVDYIINTDYSI